MVRVRGGLNKGRKEIDEGVEIKFKYLWLINIIY